MNHSLRRGILETFLLHEKEGFHTQKVLPYPQQPLPLHPSIKMHNRQAQHLPNPNQTPANLHSNPNEPPLSAASQHSRSQLPTPNERTQSGHFPPPPSPPPNGSSSPGHSIPANWTRPSACYSTDPDDVGSRGAVPTLGHAEFRAVVSQATTNSMKTLLKDTLLRETSDIQRSLQQYHTSDCKDRVAAAVHATKNATHSSPSTVSSTITASAFETAIQQFHSVDSRLLPLSALGQQSRLPLYELSTLQEKMQTWRGKYSSPMRNPITTGGTKFPNS